MNIENYRVLNGPPSIYYIPDFISKDEEQNLIENVYCSPKPKWTHLSHRRLQNWGGIPHKSGMIAEAIPEWLQKYINYVENLNIFNGKKPNHILINEYSPGQGILSHVDGPLFHPVIATISCGSGIILEFQTSLNEGSKNICNLLLEQRSLLVLKDDMYTKYLHRIDEKHMDVINEKCLNILQCSNKHVGQELLRTTRISLTIRHVPKTSKIMIKLGH